MYFHWPVEKGRNEYDAESEKAKLKMENFIN